MGKKIVAFVVILVAVLVLAFKQYVFTIILGTELDSSKILIGGVFALLFASVIAFILLSQKRHKVDSVEILPSKPKPTVKSFFTVQFAIGAFFFYLILLVMRIVLFLDMYIVSPIILMVEFTLLTIVALMLFLPHLVDKLGNEKELGEKQ